MKRYFYLVGSILTTLFATSCSKDFDCECTTTYTYSDGTSTYTSTYAPQTITIKETSKRTAKNACASTESTYTYIDSGITYTYTYTTDCELK